MTFLAIFGALLLLYGLSGFFWKHIYYAGQGREIEKEDEHYSSRYLWHPRVLFGGLLIGLFFLALGLDPILLEPKDLYFSLFFLIPGLVFSTLSGLVFFSKKFNQTFWKYVWTGPNKEKDRKYMTFTLLILGLGLIFVFYLIFSDFLMYK